MSETEYKQVQIGPKSIEIPREWVMKMAGELFEIRKDRVDPSELDEVVDLYSMPAFDEGKGPKKEQTSEIGSKKYLVPDDTLLFPKLNIRKQRFWRVKRESETKGICSTEYWPLIPQEDLDLDFYNFYFRTHEFRSHPKVSSSSSTNSHKRVNQSSFEKIKLPVPPLPEQRRIAEILSTVDEAIQQTDEIIETSKELKKGLMQDLLTKGIGHDEFKEVRLGPKSLEVPEDWNIIDFVELSADEDNSFRRGPFGGAITKDCFVDEGYKVYEQQNVINHDFSLGDYYITDEKFEEMERFRVDANDLLISCSGTIGKVARVPEDFEEGIINQALLKISIAEEHDSEFVKFLLESPLGQDILSGYQRGAVLNNIAPMKTLKKANLALPEYDEQREIAERLSVVDEKIRQEEEYREKLEELKKGLMQDLLTGEVRVQV